MLGDLLGDLPQRLGKFIAGKECPVGFETLLRAVLDLRLEFPAAMGGGRVGQWRSSRGAHRLGGGIGNGCGRRDWGWLGDYSGDLKVKI